MIRTHVYQLCLAAGVLLSGLCELQAATSRYVARNGQEPVPDYTSWGSAASNIQQAVNVADAGDTIWISNEVYTVASGGQVVLITTSMTLKGVTGNPEDVIIDGENARRGIYVNRPTGPLDIRFEGLTVRNGLGGGGGGVYARVDLAGTTGTVTFDRCVIRNSFSTGGGGGLYAIGLKDGSLVQINVLDCEIKFNETSDSSQYNRGGGIYFIRVNAEVDASRFIGNAGTLSGGGLVLRDGRGFSVIRNTLFESNTVHEAPSSPSAYLLGGGISVWDAPESGLLVENCRFLRNVAGDRGGGGGVQAGHNTRLRNCLIAENEAPSYGSGVTDLSVGGLLILENTTVVNNSGSDGVRSYNNQIYLTNSIVYHNPDGNHYNVPAANWRYSATTPITGMDSSNLSDDPWMGESPETLGYRLPSDSPSVNSGTNLPWMDTATDLAGEDRKDWVSGLVDMGCYEYTPPAPAGTTILIR